MSCLHRWLMGSFFTGRQSPTVTGWTLWECGKIWAIVYLFSCSMTQLQVRLESQPSGLLLLHPPFPASFTQPLYFLPTLNLSVSVPISSCHCLCLFRCQSSSHSLSTHLSTAQSISVDHSALLAPLVTASIDLHLLPVLLPPSPSFFSFSSIFLKFHFPSVASLHFILLIISHHFILSASVSRWLLTHQANQNQTLLLSLWFINIYTQMHTNTHSLLCSHTVIL